MPIVSIGRRMELLTPYAVVNDVVAELAHYVRAALKRNMSRIALLGCPEREVYLRWRLPAFEHAYAEVGRAVGDLLVRCGPATRADGRRLMTELLNEPRPPELVFADDDYVAYGALEAIAERGLRPPHDIQIIDIGGFLGHLIPSGPKVSAVCLPHAECARRGALMVLQLIGDRAVTDPIEIVPCTFADHGTTYLPAAPSLPPPRQVRSNVHRLMVGNTGNPPLTREPTTSASSS